MMEEDPISALTSDAHENSVDHGFWDDCPPVDPEHRAQLDAYLSMKLALIHSEISEALEELRDGSPTYYVDETTGKPEGVVTELADAVIRIADLVGWLEANTNMYGQTFGSILHTKMAYNAGRPALHGRSF